MAIRNNRSGCTRGRYARCFDSVGSEWGAPIPAAAMERLFQPFFRGEVRRSQQGLGLGLHIASEIARAHGGALTVLSDDVETRFTLAIPAQPVSTPLMPTQIPLGRARPPTNDAERIDLRDGCEVPTIGEPRMAKAPKQLDDLFHDTLKDIYFAEKKILSTLPKMAKAAQSKELKAAFEKHRGETEGHVSRLEQVFALIDQKPQGKTCEAIEGITKEGAEIIEEYEGSLALDAGLLAAAQAVEHYEISRYGTLRTWADELGLTKAVTLLEATLKEEKATDEALTQIAESVVNQEAQTAAK